MKRLYLILIALLTLSGVSNAQISGLNVGYCNGFVKTAGTTGFSTTEKDTWVSGAIFIPKDKIGVYAGNRIDSINAGLASRLNIDSLRVWIRTSLDGEDLVSGGISNTTKTKLAKGWNRIGLTTPYNIEKTGEGIYIGYSFHQKGASVGLSVVSLPQPNALFVKLGSNAEWTDRSSEGAMAIEGLVYGDNLPKYNLVLKSVSTQPVYVIEKGTLSIQATLRNIATATITGFDAQCSIDGITDTTYTAHIDEAIAYNEEKTVTFVVNPTGITGSDPSTRTVTVNLTNLKEGTDENPNDNVLSTSFDVIDHDFTRNVLVEEFTTEKCTNCPRVAGQLATVLEKDRFKGRVNVLCHHSAYETDWLTIPAASEYLWLFNMGGSTFAPALMFDRATRPYISNQSDASPIYSPQSADGIASVLDNRMLDVAFVSLNIKASIDDAKPNTVHVTVTGDRIKEGFTVNPPRINVTLFENDIKAQNQAGATAGYMQQHVCRAMNSTWGDVIEWDGNSYTYSCDLPLRSDYVLSNLGVVAYIWDYDENNASKCEVANSSSIHYSDFTVGKVTGITTAKSDVSNGEEYFSLNGTRLSAPQKGINIVRMSNGITKKVVIE